MKRFVVGCFALLVTACAPALQEGSASRVEITWAGIYTGDRITSERRANGVIQHEIAEPHLVKSTTEIPATQGIRFGVEYRVFGPAGSTVVELRRRVRYPLPGAQPPSAKSRLLYDEVAVQCAVGTICMAGYGLDQPWELIPGTWTVEFWDGDQKLAEQSFSVTQK